MIGLRGLRLGALSSSAWALLVSLLAHAAGLLLIPSWQAFERTHTPAEPTPIQARLQMAPPAPEMKKPAPESIQAAAMSRAPAGAKASAVKPLPVTKAEERAPTILTAHREAPVARHAVAPGEAQPQTGSAPTQGSTGDSAPPTAPAGRPAGEVIAFSATKAEIAQHTDVAYLHTPKPAYPPMARKLGLEGTVMLRVLVNQEGVPEQARLQRSSGAEVLDAAALDAVRGWRFTPAREGKVAITHWVDVPVTFKLGTRD